MKKLIIAWDVDDTLIVPASVTGSQIDTPNYENIAVLRWFQAQGHEIVIWSGGGVDYAAMWANKLGIANVTIIPKTKSDDIDICFDDMKVDLAKVNVQVKRLKNWLKRK